MSIFCRSIISGLLVLTNKWRYTKIYLIINIVIVVIHQLFSMNSITCFLNIYSVNLDNLKMFKICLFIVNLILICYCYTFLYFRQLGIFYSSHLNIIKFKEVITVYIGQYFNRQQYNSVYIFLMFYNYFIQLSCLVTQCNTFKHVKQFMHNNFNATHCPTHANILCIWLNKYK